MPRKQIDDLPAHVFHVPFFLVEWLPVVFDQSPDWVEDKLVYPCDSQKRPLIDPETKQPILGVPIAKLGNKRVGLWEDLVEFIRSRAQPQVRSTWKNLLEDQRNGGQNDPT